MLDELGFTVLVLMAILSTAISSRAIHSFYEPLKQTVATRRTVGSLRPHSELRTLACLHNEGPIPFLTSLLECLSSASHPLCAYVLHMVDLAGRADSTLIAHKDRRGLVNMTHMDPIMCAFVTYEQHKKGQLVVQPFTARAPFKTMYHDVCVLSVEKSAHVVVVPFPRKGAMGPGGDGGGRELDQAARGVATEVLEAATCTVGILVYEVFGYSAMPSPVDFRYDVGLLFWGGPDDREALAITMRMALHGAVAISVLRFTRAEGGHGVEEEWRQDEALLQQARAEEAVAVAEVAVSNVEETMAVIRTMNDKRHDMVVVGRRQGADSFLEGLLEWCEFQELGVIGDMLASDFKHTNSILVVQTPSRYTDSDQ